MNQNKLSQSISIVLLSAVFALVTLAVPFATGQTNAESLSQLRARSAALQAEIDAASKKAEHLDHKADTLKSTIDSLDADIRQASAKIELTTLKIQELEHKLVQTQKELDRQKEMLKASMRALYKRGGASTVELLVGSDSFSEFMDEQEYLERLKLGIQDSTEKVIELKQKIQAQKDEQKELLARQESAKKSLDGMRAQKAELLHKTRGQEAQFKQIVSDLEKKRAQVDRQLTALIVSQQYNNYGVVSGGGKLIGRVGSTGFSTGPHLHFEMRNSSGQVMNPSGTMGSWPVSGRISQGYGCVAPYSWYFTKCGSGKSLHPGIDIAADYGAPVTATKAGVIIYRGYDGAYGNKVVIKHNDGTFSVYGHLSSFQ